MMNIVRRLRHSLASLFSIDRVPILGPAIQKRRDKRHWDERIADVLACPDNKLLPRHPQAGQIVDGFQVMHNGLLVKVDGYYGNGITRMLRENRGCHEPQEEVLFREVLSVMEPGMTFIEAGAYWGFYSMWAAQAVPNAKLYLIEPERSNLEVGQVNFTKNGVAGDFTHAFVSDQNKSLPGETRVLNIETFCDEKRIDRVGILHADIQGNELNMLVGAESLIRSQRIDFLFISTHYDRHEKCEAWLREHGYTILDSTTPEQSYSFDGILVACAPDIPAPQLPITAKK